MLANCQRDLTAEQAAERLRYRKKSNVLKNFTDFFKKRDNVLGVCLTPITKGKTEETRKLMIRVP